MGFIMSRGQGTDEVLAGLEKAFRRDIKITASRHKPDFAQGKPLHAAANAMKLWPADPTQKNDWLRWLAWLSGFPQEHEVIRQFLFSALSAEQPAVIVWDEDPTATAATPPKVATGTATDAGKPVGVLFVMTCTAAKIPKHAESR
jgi:hypothetical protein